MRRPLLLATTLLALVSCSGGESASEAGEGDAAAASSPEAPAELEAPGEPAQPTEPAQPIEIVQFEGLDAILEAHRGEGLLLNFWAIWCAPCVEELPELLEVAAEYEDRGGSVVGISYDLMIPTGDPSKVTETMAKFLDRKGWSFPVYIYDDIDYDRINERFALEGGVPVTLAIDENGDIVDAQHGQASKARFDELMRKALGI